MLKTTRNTEGKQTEPSKTLVHIIRNRLHLKTARLIQHTALFTEIRPLRTDSAYNLLAAIHNAARCNRVSDALSLIFKLENMLSDCGNKSNKNKSFPLKRLKNNALFYKKIHINLMPTI